MNSGFTSISVLIVDDDDYQRKLMHRMLTSIGIVDIHQAASAKAALAITVAKRASLHVIISDLDMPDVDGMEFLRQLSEHKVEAAVLILSGKHDSILRSVSLMAKEYGLVVLGALPKPASIPVLREAFVAYLNHSRVRVRAAAMTVSAEEILQGLVLGQFEPFYQPKVDLQSRRVCGAEVLARWRHPVHGILAPAMFINLAEQHGLIDRLTWAQLDMVAAQARLWQEAGLDISLSINFSQTSLADTRLSNQVTDVLFRHGVSPEKLIVEVTETVAMTDIAHSLETLARLRMKGVGLSIDDFGTGHSSLQQLSRVPYTELKIDRMFVTGASMQPHLRAVAESSVHMAKNLGLKCVGEGIETLEDWNYLQQLGCDIGQGYYIAKPMEGALFSGWVLDWERDNCLQRKPDPQQA